MAYNANAQKQPAGARLFDDLAKRGQLSNGVLLWPAFNALCKQIGWDDKAANSLWRQVDADKGGSIDRREFLNFAARPDVNPYLVPFENRICGAAVAVAAAPAQGTGSRLWEHLTRNGQVTQGSIKWPGFLALCQSIGWDQKAATTLWNQVDADKGGSIDRREFMVFAARPDVNQYLAAYENRVCAQAMPQQGFPAQGGGAGLPPGQRLWNQFQAQGKIVSGTLSWSQFAPLCAQIGWKEDIGRVLWNQTDVDKSGTLDNREFLSFASRPDVKPYLVPYEDRTCAAVPQGPPMGGGGGDFGARLFDFLDGRGEKRDGVISWAEFAPMCQQAGWDPSVARMLWNDADTDRSGSLSKQEFVRFANRPDVRPALEPLLMANQAPPGMPPAGMPPPGMRLFDYLDGRGSVKDGVLSWEEFAPLCAQIGWSPDIARTLWNQTDTDRNGTLSRSEFLTFASRNDVRPYLIPMEDQILRNAGYGPMYQQGYMGGPMMGGPPPMYGTMMPGGPPPYGQAYGPPAYGGGAASPYGGGGPGPAYGPGPYGAPPGSPAYGPAAGGPAYGAPPAFLGQTGPQQSYHNLPQYPGAQGGPQMRGPQGPMGPQGPASPRGPAPFNPSGGPPPMMGGPPPMGGQPTMGGQPPYGYPQYGMMPQQSQRNL